MTFFGIIKRSLVFFWRTNLGVFAAAAVATMILTGALFVGDSVRYSLWRSMDARLGSTQIALAAPNRFFRSALADDLSTQLDAAVASVLQIGGLIANDDDSRRTPKVQVLGVDQRFFAMRGTSLPVGLDDPDSVVLNEPLAERLGVGVGDEVLLRIAKPGLMPLDVPLTPDSDLSVGFRLTVKALASESDFGRFSLLANQISPFNAFVPLKWLGEKTEHAGNANMLLIGPGRSNEVTTERADQAVADCLKLADIALEVRRLPEQGQIEVVSSRVFIDDALTDIVASAAPDSVGILTYFVNELRIDPNSTPYSFVAALDTDKSQGVLPPDMSDNDIVINEWLAQDLGAKVGDSLTLTYYVMGPMRKLQTQSRPFVVRKIVPFAGIAGDPQLMPAFPGLADADDCRDWKPGIDIDLDRIRDKDEQYWDMFRGVPKAFITLSAGQSMWSNRFGKLTAVRYSARQTTVEDVSSQILQAVDPASVGLFFQPVRQLAQKAGKGGTDFGGLFLGLSMFLIASAVILLGLVFIFGVEKRSSQSGILLAVGFPHKMIRRLFLIEGAIISACGAVAGTLCALLYTKIMTWGLSSAWKSAVGGSMIHFHAGPVSILCGTLAGIVVALVAIVLTLRRHLARPAGELLVGGLEDQFLSGKARSKGTVAFGVAAVCFAAAVAILFFFGSGDSAAASGSFFGAGALLLTAILAVFHGCMTALAGRGRVARTIWALGLRNTTRRRGRSLAVVALLAAGCFLVISVGAFRENALTDAHQRSSGTGGFALIGESSIPILHDLGAKKGRQSLNLDEDTLADTEVVQLRLRDGDDASCLNLNRAQRPRLIGVDPDQFQSRGSFTFVETIKDAGVEDGWKLLDMDLGEGIVPAIGDDEMIKWILGKSVGDDLDYTDERGRNFKLRIVAGLRSSILQGSLVISTSEFEKLFPNEPGYRMFLVDTDIKKAKDVQAALTDGLVDFGAEFAPAVGRLQELYAVKNTYLSMFQLLGGLGLVLGSVGLGLVVLLNILERRGEFGMLRAIGFSREKLKRMALYEHVSLVAAGLSGSIVSALIAIAPAMSAPGSELPFAMLFVIIMLIAASAGLWIWAATTVALKADLLDAIRNE